MNRLNRIPYASCDLMWCAVRLANTEHNRTDALSIVWLQPFNVEKNVYTNLFIEIRKCKKSRHSAVTDVHKCGKCIKLSKEKRQIKYWTTENKTETWMRWTYAGLSPKKGNKTRAMTGCNAYQFNSLAFVFYYVDKCWHLTYTCYAYRIPKVIIIIDPIAPDRNELYICWTPNEKEGKVVNEPKRSYAKSLIFIAIWKSDVVIRIVKYKFRNIFIKSMWKMLKFTFGYIVILWSKHYKFTV